MSNRVHVGPPRSPHEPMAFSRDDFFRGAMWTLCAFVALLVTAEILVSVISDVVARTASPMPVASSTLALLPLTVGYTVVIAGIVGAVCLVLGSPLAYVLARSMRRVRSIAAHVVVFASFGAVFGGLCAGLVYVGMVLGGGNSIDIAALAPIVALGAGFTAAACAIGWSMAARRARRDDRAAAGPASRSVSAARAAAGR